MKKLNNRGNVAGGVAVGVAVLALLWFMFCFRIVGVGQVGIITRFGRVTREAGSGVLVKAPWPIEHLTKMNVRTQKEQQSASAATKDLQTVNATVAVNYNLTSATALKVYQNVGTDFQNVVVDPIIQNTVKAVTAEYNASDLIDSRAEVATKLNTQLVKQLSSRGITVTSTNIVNFDFSAQFNDAIEQKQVAQQNAQKAQYELQTAQTQAQANQVQDAALSPAILEQQAIAKWDGHMPNAVSGSSGTIFGINIQGSN